ncbi:hypothetical protein C0991_001842 [Blastosporella zonata]|nr:hypothetical protein C0991_001842 [Blastosporella zonata]
MLNRVRLAATYVPSLSPKLNFDRPSLRHNAATHHYEVTGATRVFVHTRARNLHTDTGEHKPALNELSLNHDIRNTGPGVAVYNLPEPVDIKALRDTFAAFGQVKSVNISLDDKGELHGFINYASHRTVERAVKSIRAMNSTLFKDKELNIWPYYPPTMHKARRELGKANLTPLQVPKVDKQDIPKADEQDTENADITGFREEHFARNSSPSEEVKEGGSAGCGLVDAEHAEAQRAVDAPHGSENRGQQRLVGHDLVVGAVEKHQAKNEIANANLTGLFVRNLNHAMTMEYFKTLFSRYGVVTSALFPRNQKGDRVGHGIVQYKSPLEARQAMNALHASEHYGHRLAIRFDLPEEQAKASFTDLYITNFGPTTTQKELEKLVAPYGTAIVNIVVDREGKRLGFGIVYYATHGEAQQALEALNGFEHQGHRLVVCRSKTKGEREKVHRDMLEHQAQLTQIFVNNLPRDMRQDEFKHLVSKHGTVISAKMPVNREGKCVGYGFVSYADPTEARRAIDALHDSKYRGRKLQVINRVEIVKEKPATEQETTEFTLFVKNLDPTMTEKELGELFSSQGAITSTSIPVDDEGKGVGYGFVDYANHEEAQQAINALHGSEYNNRKLIVKRQMSPAARLKEDMTQFRNVYVKNLHPCMTQKELQEVFSAYGNVTLVNVPLDADDMNMGYCFVHYATHAEAQQAITALHASMHFGHKIDVCRAQGKEERWGKGVPNGKIPSIFSSPGGQETSNKTVGGSR